MRRSEIDQILTQLLERYEDVSDINITVGKPFQVESAGQLIPAELSTPILSITPFQTEIFSLNLMQGNPKLVGTLLETGSCDCAYQVRNGCRFRVNIFSQRGNLSIVLRKLSTHIPTIKEMNLPQVFYKIPEEKNGLVLITGSTGSGKSTSAAAMLRHLNETKAIHVVTLEDPIEYEHPHEKATFNQRELGIDFNSFATGLKAALRQAPKAILVGEMRDRETVEIALTAGETGHVVYSTLHTIDAGQTITRIVGMFDREEEELIRSRLADSLRWVVCQRLVPKVGGGRAGVFEILTNTLRTRDLITNGESEEITFYDVISQGGTYGMKTFDQNLLELFDKDLISEETAKAYCSRKSVMIQGVDRIKAAKGIATSDLGDLSMEHAEKASSYGTSLEELMPQRRSGGNVNTSKRPFSPRPRPNTVEKDNPDRHATSSRLKVMKSSPEIPGRNSAESPSRRLLRTDMKDSSRRMQLGDPSRSGSTGRFKFSRDKPKVSEQNERSVPPTPSPSTPAPSPPKREEGLDLGSLQMEDDNLNQ